MKITSAKEVQAMINHGVDSCFNEYVNGYSFEGKPFIRLRTCQAWVYIDGPVAYLKSYNTVIAMIINYRSHVARIDFLRKVYGYTATSSQHINKFYRDYTPTGLEVRDYVWRVIK